MNTIMIESKGKNDQDFLNLRWVLKARCKDATSVHLSGFHVADGDVVSTDGCRMHIYQTKRELPNGTYTVKAENAKVIVMEEMDCIFVDYKRAIPLEAENKMEMHCNGDNGLFFKIALSLTAENEYFNTDYLRDAYMENAEVTLSKSNNPLSPLLVKCENKTAVVMPCTLR